MSRATLSKLPITDEDAATGEVAATYGEIQRVMEIPFVPNIYKTVASSPVALNGTWDLFRNVFLETSLPLSLASMILFSIAAAKKCRYCSAVHQATCKTLGVDETTLSRLQSDLAAVAPQRVQAIVQFAVKCALSPQALQHDDYEAVRAQGVSDQELMEIIALAALGNYLDTLADGMKIEVDRPIAEALQG